MKTVFGLIIILGLSSCANNHNYEKTQIEIQNIEDRLGIKSSAETSDLNRLMKINEALSNEKDVFMLINKNVTNEVDYGEAYKAMFMIRKTNPLLNEHAVVVYNDSIIPLDYDYDEMMYTIDIQSNKVGHNDCSGAMVYNNNRDTVLFDCSFVVKSPIEEIMK